MRLSLPIALLFLSSSAVAVVPQFWRVRNTEDFLAGEVDGFAVTSRGELRPAPAVKKIASFTDPFVLSQAAAPNGDRYFGTGNDGKVYRLRGNDLKLVWTAPEPEIYTVAWHDGALYAGTSPNGKIYRVDAPLSEISAIYVDANGTGWAAAASNVLPSSAPSKPQPKTQPGSGSSTSTTAGAERKKEEPTPSVEVSYSFDDSGAAAAATGGGSGEIYRIDPDGFVQTVRKFEREMVYAISGGPTRTTPPL